MTKSAWELIREVKQKLCDEFMWRKVRRDAKLGAAFAEYFAEKWQDEFEIISSDAIAAAKMETDGGIYISLTREAQGDPSYYSIKFNAAAAALEKLKERGFEVELDISNDDPDVYRIWKKNP
jgi:hypothetical protein